MTTPQPEVDALPPSKLPVIDEREPLLPPQPLEVSEAQEDELTVKKVEAKRRWWDLVVYAILAVLAVTGASIVIKGFIESDDSEFDLGKAFKDALGGGLSGAAGTFRFPER